MQLIKKGPRVTSRQLASFEKFLGFRLPDSYKKFLQKSNGGIPKKTEMLWKDNQDREHGTTIAKFLSLGVEGGLEDTYRNSSSSIPPKFLPVAEDIAGNLLCLCAEGNELGSICFWDHELSSDDPKSLVMICLSISELDSHMSYEALPSPFEDLLQRTLSDDDATTLEKLLSDGLDVNFNDSAGLSLIEKAAMFSLPRIFKCLLERGAVLGRSQEFATRLNRTQILDILERWKFNLHGEQER